MSDLQGGMQEIMRKARNRGEHELRKVRVGLYEAVRSRQANWLGVGPAAHVRWVKRLGRRPTAWAPPWWRTLPQPERQADPRLAVVIHVYYPELVDELTRHLEVIPVPFDVLVTNASEETVEEDRFRVGNAGRVVVLPVENSGRDLAPLVFLVNAGYLDPYDLVLKLHTKKSAWREEHEALEGSGVEWREALLDGLVGSTENVEEIIGAFAADPGLGCVTADGSIVGPEHWGNNEHAVNELLKRIGMEQGYSDLEFAAGSMYWIRAFVLQGLRAFTMGPADFEDEDGQIDGTTAHALERIIGIVTREAGFRLATASDAKEIPHAMESWQRFLPDHAVSSSARVVPFYLPQFHPSPVNDSAWGKGFTEWQNVAQGKPMFEGHVQPLVPSELGFYDLRMDEVRHEQLALEKYAGIAGFMYYYYWFSGEKVLNLPIERLVADPTLDQPFCVMWANENWTKAWDGRGEDVLLAQRYDEVGADTFIDDIMPLLGDTRYMRIDGKAILAVYRAAQIPDVKETVESWRRQAREAGVGELCLLSVDTGQRFDGLGARYEEFGFDGRMGFPPHEVVWTAQSTRGLKMDELFVGRLLSYRETVRNALSRARQQDRNSYPAVMVTFDNTARKKSGSDIWYGSNPYTFRRWLAQTVGTVAARQPDERVVFVNAWNEWAESAVLEPTLRWGPTYLQAVRSVVYQ